MTSYCVFLKNVKIRLELHVCLFRFSFYSDWIQLSDVYHIVGGHRSYDIDGATSCIHA